MKYIVDYGDFLLTKTFTNKAKAIKSFESRYGRDKTAHLYMYNDMCDEFYRYYLDIGEWSLCDTGTVPRKVIEEAKR
jgi:hypothetical protein